MILAGMGTKFKLGHCPSKPQLAKTSNITGTMGCDIKYGHRIHSTARRQHHRDIFIVGVLVGIPHKPDDVIRLCQLIYTIPEPLKSRKQNHLGAFARVSISSPKYVADGNPSPNVTWKIVSIVLQSAVMIRFRFLTPAFP